MLGTTGKKI